MLANEIRIAIPGHPKTKGSMKCIGRVGKRGHVLIEDHKTSKPWLDTLTGWLNKMLAGREAAAGQPLGVEASFSIDRPKSHYGTGKNARTMKDRFLNAYPVGHNTGDVDKLLRVVLDALQKADVIPDDCAVVECTTRKGYITVGDPVDDFMPNPGVVVRLYPIKET